MQALLEYIEVSLWYLLPFGNLVPMLLLRFSVTVYNVSLKIAL